MAPPRWCLLLPLRLLAVVRLQCSLVAEVGGFVAIPAAAIAVVADCSRCVVLGCCSQSCCRRQEGTRRFTHLPNRSTPCGLEISTTSTRRMICPASKGTMPCTSTKRLCRKIQALPPFQVYLRRSTCPRTRDIVSNLAHCQPKERNHDARAICHRVEISAAFPPPSPHQKSQLLVTAWGAWKHGQSSKEQES